MRKWKVGLSALALTAVIGTGAAAASGWTEKIEAFFTDQISVVLNGKSIDEDIKVLMVDGKVYVPIREYSNQLGFNVSWNSNESRVEITGQVKPEEVLRLSGIIVEAVDEENGGKLIHVMGKSKIGVIENVRLHVTPNTLIRSNDGKLLKAVDLKENMKIEVDFDQKLTRSLPPIGQAISIRTEMERALASGAIQEVERRDQGATLILSTKESNDPLDTIILHISDDTKIALPNGEQVSLDQLKKGMDIKAYYGPFMTMSLPPQSSAELIIVSEDQLELN